MGIPAIVKTIEATRIRKEINPHNVAVVVGLSFISIGMFAIVAALREHRKAVRRIQSDRFTYESSQTAEIVGIALLLVGLVSFLGVLLKAFDS